MLIYNLINNSTKKNGKKSLQTFAHLLWEQGVVGSNPATPTKEKDFDKQ